MKKLLITAALTLFSVMSFAQTAYEKAMTEKIGQAEKMLSADEFTALANDFVRIGNKEKTQWLPYYYAALTTIQKGRTLMQAGKTNELDPIADEAQKYLDQSVELNKENAENYILQKMIHSLKMMVNPMERFQTEGTLAAQALAKATALDKDNPRITLLNAEDTYFTPEQFGGSKEKGLELFKKALEQYGQYKPASSMSPNWGKAEALYFLGQAKQ